MKIAYGVESIREDILFIDDGEFNNMTQMERQEVIEQMVWEAVVGKVVTYWNEVE
jgi:hypothetical protein